MKKLTAFLVILCASCSLFAPSSIKIKNASNHDIIVHNKNYNETIRINSKKTAYTTAYPGKLQLHIADPQGLFAQEITINIAYQSTYEFVYENSISNEK